jgi:hypothetical protein
MLIFEQGKIIIEVMGYCIQAELPGNQIIDIFNHPE